LARLKESIEVKKMKSRTGVFLAAIILSLIPFVELHSAQEAQKSKPVSITNKYASRDEWQMPVRVMDEIGVKPGLTVADIGAGEGYFTFFLAERVGPSGKVFAEDIDAKSLKTIRDRCAKEQVRQVEIIQGGEDDPMIPLESTDTALMVNVLPNVEHPPSFLRNVAKILKSEGTLVIIHWEQTKLYPSEPEPVGKPSLRWTLRQIYDSGFEVVKFLTFLPAQNIWICKARDKE